MALLKVEDLKVHFPIKGGVFGRTLDYVRAVDGVSFELQLWRNVRNRWGIRGAANQQLEKRLCT